MTPQPTFAALAGRTTTTLAASMAALERAEALALALLAHTDRYGRGADDVARWEEILDQVAAMHTRLLLLRADTASTEPSSRLHC